MKERKKFKPAGSSRQECTQGQHRGNLTLFPGIRRVPEGVASDYLLARLRENIQN